MKVRTSITGFPRMGENRELKKALEDRWSGKITVEELQKISYKLREKHWLLQKDAGISFISCNDFSLYDCMLDTIVMLNAVPPRFRNIPEKSEMYFSMARGSSSAHAMEMTKWFNTNYHYIVPELDSSIEFALDPSKIISEYKQARDLGIVPKINIIGPLTFLGLAKTSDGSDPYRFIERVTDMYCELIGILSEIDDTVYLQMEEPVFVKDQPAEILELLVKTYRLLVSAARNVRIIFTTYFEHSTEAVMALENVPLWGIGLDFIHGNRNVDALKYLGGKVLFAGVVNGRNIWVNDFSETETFLGMLLKLVGADRLVVSTSCSLLHVPFSVSCEPESGIKKRMSFACEKIGEVSLLAAVVNGERSDDINMRLEENSLICEERKKTQGYQTKVPLKNVNAGRKERKGSFEERKNLQRERFRLPELPTTTIGSFPQTPHLRAVRRSFRTGSISPSKYESEIKKYIDECIEFQETAGLDVFVHGEPERTDMVEYFGEMLDGFHFTQNGWVQSYGSRCVKPPVIYGDVKRNAPMTVGWISYAQGKTVKPVKGMLTGPVTILNWSFVREDIERSEVSYQVACAICDEIDDLQNAGIGIIQVDEAAFKEGYPLRNENIAKYEADAVSDFRHAVSSASMDTQIHTHMCYSDFSTMISAIDDMDADVITIETSRSGNRLLGIFRDRGYGKDIGPGVYDIHSPAVPSVSDIEKEIISRLEVVPMERLWINPDCGLKTRKWEEVRPALVNMVQAVRNIRKA